MEAAAATGTKREVRREMKLTLQQHGSSFASMKRVLSLLMAYVFLQTQSWALSGGPFGISQESLSGTYAGTLFGSDPTTGETGMGIFSIGIQPVGPGAGAFAYFGSGQTFIGTIVGVADTSKRRLTALMTGQFDIVQTVGSVSTSVNGVPTSTQPVNASQVVGVANGKMDARFSLGSSSGIRLTGKAEMTTFSALTPRQDFTLTVEGFFQSSQVSDSFDAIDNL